jgi:hypothetical protein
MISSIGAFLRHLRIRVVWVARTPASLTVMVLSAAATLLLWPGLDLGVERAGPAALGWIAWLLWMQLWPALPAIAAAGRSTGGFDTAVSTRWLPVLPVGPRTRALADAAVVVLFVLGAHITAAWVLPDRELTEAISAALIGAVMMFPSLLAWTVPSRSFNVFMFRPLIAAALVLTASGIGLTGTPVRAIVVCGVLAAAILTQARRELILPRLGRRHRRPADLFRPAMDPEQRLTRDLWELPARQFGPWLALSVVALVVLTGLDRRVALPDLSIFISAEAVIIILVMAAVKPFGSHLVVAGMAGRYGASFGDFSRAWSALPVRPESVLRRTWTYSVALTLCSWLTGIGLIVARSYLNTGALRLGDGGGGGLGPVVVPLVAIVLTLPGLVVAGAVGHKAHAVVAGVVTLFILHAHVMLLAALSSAFPRGSSAPLVIDGAVVAVLALVGGLPPLVHLRTPRRAERSAPPS